jgi:hypothetical protein
MPAHIHTHTHTHSLYSFLRSLSHTLLFPDIKYTLILFSMLPSSQVLRKNVFVLNVDLKIVGKMVDKNQQSKKWNLFLKYLTHFYQGSISSTFYERLLHTKVLHAAFFYLPVTREKLPKRLLYEKGARKMLMKLIADFWNISTSFYWQQHFRIKQNWSNIYLFLCLTWFLIQRKPNNVITD